MTMLGDWMTYSLKTGACLAVFYLFFKLLLARETFHRFNRIVVLGAIVLSFVLPFCVVTVYREFPLPSEISAGAVAEAGSAPAFPWVEFAAGLLLLGAAVTLAAMLRSLYCVVRMIRTGRRERLADGTLLVHAGRVATPFSWGRCIVVGDRDLDESGETILTHERAHVRLHHSLDLLITDLAGCLQWFNPAMWLLRRELRAIHEYEADEAVLESGADARQYQLLLIKKAAGGRWYSVANSFNHSKLKNRITMMLQKRSSRWARAKALVALPLVGFALGAFAETAYVLPGDKVKKDSVLVVVGSEKTVGKISTIGTDGNPLWIVDGKRMGQEEVAKIDPSRLASITVLKDASAVETYGDEAKDGVILITLRDGSAPTEKNISSVLAYRADKGASSEKNVSSVLSYRADGASSLIVVRGGEKRIDAHDYLVVVDGERVDVSALEAQDLSKIKAITVLKDDSAVEKYGEEGRNGVIEITTK